MPRTGVDLNRKGVELRMYHVIIFKMYPPRPQLTRSHLHLLDPVFFPAIMPVRGSETVSTLNGALAGPVLLHVGDVCLEALLTISQRGPLQPTIPYLVIFLTPAISGLQHLPIEGVTCAPGNGWAYFMLLLTICPYVVPHQRPYPCLSVEILMREIFEYALTWKMLQRLVGHNFLSCSPLF